MIQQSLFKTRAALAILLFAGFTFSAFAHTPAAKNPIKKSGTSEVMKMQVKSGVSLDEAAESMRLRANALNMKLVAELPLSSQVEAITGKPQRRVTIFQFCDAITAKDLIELNIDFAVYMPCRIALIEDAKGQAWLVMMDIDVDAVAREKRVPAELKKRIQDVRNTLIAIMQAGAKGDL
ncbi:MAG: DUF302 domain-containing protein [Thiobacillus sp.]